MRLRYEKSIEGCEPVQGKSVLDVGCGPGHYSITVAQRGASRVVGIDFADGMLKLATEHAQKVGVGDRCKFMVADFYTYQPQEMFDYVIVMGFMDYMPDAEKVVAKVLSLTRNKAFFSFPVAGGMLGWQRQMRYKKRCDLFLYTKPQLQEAVREVSRGEGDDRAHQPRLLRDVAEEREQAVAWSPLHFGWSTPSGVPGAALCDFGFSH